eukprot:CAMPEP_0201938724 /NCGR_PEP_ID=MMETSP0903-20130614/41858_1 /ASSEMBLY_ACC=CAM_ASM_000552 /TAXON_ID=420261 /ORGANISM="Thalassiosira antarctica, Strain CCMP982" /LENGTH=81 /DNA_ID=CAMNT_0048480053 /DNA_START=269 /DNA_END=517 /DNA_ORIENTATION=-
MIEFALQKCTVGCRINVNGKRGAFPKENILDDPFGGCFECYCESRHIVFVVTTKITRGTNAQAATDTGGSRRPKTMLAANT